MPFASNRSNEPISSYRLTMLPSSSVCSPTIERSPGSTQWRACEFKTPKRRETRPGANSRIACKIGSTSTRSSDLRSCGGDRSVTSGKFKSPNNWAGTNSGSGLFRTKLSNTGGSLSTTFQLAFNLRSKVGKAAFINARGGSHRRTSIVSSVCFNALDK